MFMRSLGILIAMLGLLIPMPGQASERVTIEVWVVPIDRLKVLPRGHHHFRPVPPEIGTRQIPSGDEVLCESLEGAISLGKRLWEGMNAHDAAHQIARAHGRAVCGMLSREVLLQPTEVAIRSHDGVHRVYVIRARDEYGRMHYAVKPVR